MGVVGAVTTVFEDIGEWFLSMLPTVSEAFYNSTAGTLTFLGTLAVTGLGISILLLIMNIIQGFLHFRG